ncbi:hypothetical protein Dda_8286 [Drechslerella dactyloides]|uniref:Uncharacterized protein n=1 Tax=Drechslerella dactyloides TaxID=74499 RepID=A0AAD6IVY7_DREDA|nr:hypothetical protein Dda_8286 [Drechslerella dactyloides]
MEGVKMIFSLLFALCFWVPRCLAAPVSNPTTDGESLAATEFLEGITWVGPVHPGGVNHTFFGNVDQIRQQIKTAPGFDPAIFNSNAATTANVTDLERFLEGRAPHYNIQCVRSSLTYEGGYLPAFIDSIIKIKALPGGCFVDGPGCKRFACSKNASLGLCNSKAIRLEFTCQELARISEIMVQVFVDDYLKKIRACNVSPKSKGDTAYYKGTVYWTDDGKWWFVQAYGAPCLTPVLTIPESWPKM